MESFPCQKDLFSIEEGVHYLNCAAYSPLLNSSKRAGYQGIALKCNPQNIAAKDHFEGVEKLRRSIADLLDARDHDRIALFPSVSYGMAIVAANIGRVENIASKDNIIILQDEFPNDTYAFSRVTKDLDLSIVAVPQPEEIALIGELWNMAVLQHISSKTAAVVLPHVHWMYGVMFNLEEIGNKCRECGALLVIDGSQSVGALPLDVGRIQPDALICAGYKWTFGPYSLSFGYFGEFFDNGIPLEESWMNRIHSDDFSALTDLQDSYRPKAQRYNMGEHSNFIYTSMLQDSLTQLLSWRVLAVREYTRGLSDELVQGIVDMSEGLDDAARCRVVPTPFRAPHLIAVLLPASWETDASQIASALKKKHIYVSARGPVLRVSLNVFNDSGDVRAFLAELSDILYSCSLDPSAV